MLRIICGAVNILVTDDLKGQTHQQHINFFDCLLFFLFVIFFFPLPLSREHMASTKYLHLTRFSAVAFVFSLVRSLSLSSCRTMSLQLFFGLPRLLKPWGFQYSAILTIQSGFFLNVWLIHTHFFLFDLLLYGAPPLWESTDQRCWWCWARIF